jgi:hypothetical protein
VLLLLALPAVLYAQNKACEKTCLDQNEGPCSGMTGKAFAQCLGECKKACNPPPPPPPLLEPACSNRTMTTGKPIRCTIVQPNVSVPQMTYQSQIQFAPGDIVSVQADGCVQTGGHGSTWKRYVNPSGDESDSKYHGLMKIPTAFPAGSGLIRISNFIGKLQLVQGDPNVPASELFLTLGYEDSDYSDNGYYSHDDGTDNQCQIAGINDGGPAHVTLLIYRGVAPDAPQSRYDFDVDAIPVPPTDKNNKDLRGLGLDHNGLLLNPVWSWQQRSGNQDITPSTSQCHELSARPHIIGIPEPYLVPYVTDCTDQMDVYNTDSDMEGPYQWGLCALGKWGPFETGSFPGHFNWFPVTLEGRSNWGDHGGPFPNGDDDYTFTFHSPSADPLSVNGRSGLHVEFDSDETIDNFKSQPWQDLHNSVNDADGAKVQLSGCGTRHPCTSDTIAQLNERVHAPAKFFDGDTSVLIGMFGLDGEHDLKAELHPLFVFASQLNSQSNPLDEVWLMFVRNRGDEGFCSSRLWDSGLEDYIVHLRWRPGATGVTVNLSKSLFEGPEGTSGPNYMVVPPGSQDDPGVYAIFHLGSPASQPFIDGSVHLVWTGVPTFSSQGSVVSANSQIEITPSKAKTTKPAPTTTVAKAPVQAEAKAPPVTPQAKTTTPAPAQPAVVQGQNTAKLEEAGEIETTLSSTATQLTDAQLKSIAAARPPVKLVNVHQLPPGKVQTVSALPPALRAVSIKTYNGGPATEKVARDKAGIKALCASTNNAPPGLRTEACNPPASKPAPTPAPKP